MTSTSPNQFVNARLLLKSLHDVAAVPSNAVQQGAPSILDSRMERCSRSGISPGERVVGDGADRLRDGAEVSIASEEQPKAVSAAARPPEGAPARGRPVGEAADPVNGKGPGKSQIPPKRPSKPANRSESTGRRYAAECASALVGGRAAVACGPCPEPRGAICASPDELLRCHPRLAPSRPTVISHAHAPGGQAPRHVPIL